MKKLIYSITLTVLIFSGLKATTNIDKVADPKESIKYAIKKSSPDLLKKALTNFELSESDKNWLLIYANEVAQIRKNKITLNLIKPKHKSTPYSDYLMLSIITFICGYYTTAKSLEQYPKIPVIFPIITATTTFFAIKKLMAIGNKKNQEYFALHPYRTPKQKYLDSINILELIQKVNS